MKIYYNLDTRQAHNFANLKTGEKIVIVAPLKEQLPEGYVLNCPVPYENRWWMFVERNKQYDLRGEIKIECQYPLNARVGLRETWFKDPYFVHFSLFSNGEYHYKSDSPSATYYTQRVSFPENICKWQSAQCMPYDAIRFWGIVEDVRGDRVQKITYKELMLAGCREDERTEDWFNRRYKDKWTWEQNPYCEIGTLRKGE